MATEAMTADGVCCVMDEVGGTITPGRGQVPGEVRDALNRTDAEQMRGDWGKSAQNAAL